MKKITIIAAALTLTLAAYAQNESDILLTSRQAPTGTARSMALSNAMGAIGGDMTAISFNPAGIGIYRTSDFSITTGVQVNNSTTDYLNTSTTDSKTIFALSQLGFVSTFKNPSSDTKGIVSSHFGFNYNRLNNFNQNIWLSGINKNSSMLDMWALNANGNHPDGLTDYTKNYVLAYQTYLTNETTPGSYLYDHVLGQTNDDTGIFEWQATNGMQQTQIIEKSGNGGEYAFTGGINIGNILLIGGSVGFQNIRNEQMSFYQEKVVDQLTPAFSDDLDYFNFYETWNRYGTSTNVKLGIILKPVNAIRLGFAFHSPNWYNLREEYYTQVESKFLDNPIPYVAEQELTGEYEYKLTTPMKFIGSFALVSNIGFISIDYEFQDYSTAKFNPYDNNYEYSEHFWNINQDIKTYFTQTHSVRLGGEIRLQNILLRGGAGIYTSPYDTDYLSEPMIQQTYSAGFGYRTQSFYLDMGYMMLTHNEDYYPYNYDASAPENQYLVEGRVPEASTITSLTHNVMMTIGFKF